SSLLGLAVMFLIFAAGVRAAARGAWHLHRWARPAAIAFAPLVIVFGLSVIGGPPWLRLACLVTTSAVIMGLFLPAVVAATNRTVHDCPAHISPRRRPVLHPGRLRCDEPGRNGGEDRVADAGQQGRTELEHLAHQAGLLCNGLTARPAEGIVAAQSLIEAYPEGLRNCPAPPPSGAALWQARLAEQRRQQGSQSRRVLERLPTSLPEIRRHRMRGVAEEDDPVSVESRQRGREI